MTVINRKVEFSIHSPEGANAIKLIEDAWAEEQARREVTQFIFLKYYRFTPSSMRANKTRP